MKYSIKQVSEIAGISIRTLHYYDEQNLLIPIRDPSNDYRIYNSEHMLLLQQILIYREMDFSIAKIKSLLKQNEQSLLESLKIQKQVLTDKTNHLNSLIAKIEVSMNKLDKQRIDQTLYEGIDKQKASSWEEQARDKFTCEKVDQSYQRVSKLSQEQLKEVKKEGEQIAIDIALLMSEQENKNKVSHLEESDKMQNIVKRHHVWIEHFYDAPFDVYTALADMYLQSEEFTQFYDKHKSGSTLLLNNAIHYYAKHNL